MARDRIASTLPTFEVLLHRDGVVVDRGHGGNVLDSPALALQHLARLIASQTDAPPLSAGEIITTGTITDAWPVVAGEHWSADYGDLRLSGLELTLQ